MEGEAARELEAEGGRSLAYDGGGGEFFCFFFFLFLNDLHMYFYLNPHDVISLDM